MITLPWWEDEAAADRVWRLVLAEVGRTCDELWLRFGNLDELAYMLPAEQFCQLEALVGPYWGVPDPVAPPPDAVAESVLGAVLPAVVEAMGPGAAPVPPWIANAKYAPYSCAVVPLTEALLELLVSLQRTEPLPTNDLLDRLADHWHLRRNGQDVLSTGAGMAFMGLNLSSEEAEALRESLAQAGLEPGLLVERTRHSQGAASTKGRRSMTCTFCDAPATHRCEQTGYPLCWGHARVAVVSPEVRTQGQQSTAPAQARVAGPEHREELARIMLDFWGKTDNMLTYGVAWDMLAQPAVVAHVGEQLAGALIWAPFEGRGIILDLSVYPQYQATGVAAALFALAEQEMRKAGLSAMILSTTNDNIPALYFYQRRGFVIEQVLPGVALAHHEASGEPETGFAGIQVRDEFRLVKPLG